MIRGTSLSALLDHFNTVTQCNETLSWKHPIRELRLCCRAADGKLEVDLCGTFWINSDIWINSLFNFWYIHQLNEIFFWMWCHSSGLRHRHSNGCRGSWLFWAPTENLVQWINNLIILLWHLPLVTARRWIYEAQSHPDSKHDGRDWCCEAVFPW